MSLSGFSSSVDGYAQILNVNITLVTLLNSLIKEDVPQTLPIC